MLGLMILWVIAANVTAATHQVTMEGLKFNPSTVSVRSGDSIVWTNSDLVPHTVTSPGHFDSKQIAAGKSWTWKAGPKGHYQYVCLYHAGMEGGVVVE